MCGSPQCLENRRLAAAAAKAKYAATDSKTGQVLQVFSKKSDAKIFVSKNVNANLKRIVNFVDASAKQLNKDLSKMQIKPVNKKEKK